MIAATTAPYKPKTITPDATKPPENPPDISSRIPAMKIITKIGRNTIKKTRLDFINPLFHVVDKKPFLYVRFVEIRLLKFSDNGENLSKNSRQSLTSRRSIGSNDHVRALNFRLDDVRYLARNWQYFTSSLWKSIFFFACSQGTIWVMDPATIRFRSSTGITIMRLD